MGNPTKTSKVGSVTIATVKSRAEARRIATQLEAAGIDCSLMDERAATAGGLGQTRVGGIKVQVDRGDVRRAVQLMGEKVGHTGAGLSERHSLRSASRFWLKIDGWKLAAVEIAAIVACAGLLARFLFY
jgi:hypothetical protein